MKEPYVDEHSVDEHDVNGHGAEAQGGEAQGGEAQGAEAQGGTKPAELACPTCGEVVYPGEDFCEACGGRLGNGPAPDSGGAPAAPGPSARVCAGCGGARIDADGYCETCGLRQPAERDHVELEVPSASGGDPPAAAGASDRGKRYSRNEDALAMAAHANGIAAVVCDGVGSSPHPEDASRAAADTGAADLVARLDAGEDPAAATREAALKAAAAVAALAPSPSESPSCTYVSAVTGPDSVTVGWIGDSRAYWLSGPRRGPRARTATARTPPS
ncbi:hypothetical protein GEV43_04175 [Actinomadura sp. J1-007]|nr:hypothetical protein [Actinomadura sp. J1-007]